MRWLLCYILLAMAAVGCTSTKYVPVETVRTEYKDRTVHSHTTDTVNNTRFVFVKGDTVFDFREKERVRTVEIHDTCYVMLTDSVSVPYPAERELTRWEQAKMDFGGIAIGGVLAALCFAVIWLIRKFRK